jgi:tRNA threonylcarbamoyladenosine biosynthesis protein TsaB
MSFSPSDHGRQGAKGAQATTVLALDTSTIACSVALAHRGTVVEDHRVAPRQHNQLVLQMVDALMQSAHLGPADLDAVAFGRGPGSFTGIRIAAGIAQGISLGRGIPVVPVSSLQVLAQTAATTRPDAVGFLATIQSRPDEVYFAGYRCRDGVCLPVIAEQVARSAELTLPPEVNSDWCIVGDGARHFAAVLAQRQLACAMDPSVLPSAAALLTLALPQLMRGGGVDAAHALPVYLDATRPWRKLAD